MPDQKDEEPDQGQGHGPDQDADGGRWITDAAGIESIGAVIEIEDLTTPEQKKRNAEAMRFRAESLDLARKLAAEGIDDDEDAEDDAAQIDAPLQRTKEGGLL